VPQNATPVEIRTAYRKLVFRYHPDQNRGGTSGEERFREIKEAWEVLRDPVKRRYHDATLRSIHVYAPSYEFGKFTSPQKPPQAPRPEPIPVPVQEEDSQWVRIITPLIFALVAVLLTWLMVRPPQWLQDWMGH
jgi:curved DNA-binding protein CbpA